MLLKRLLILITVLSLFSCSKKQNIADFESKKDFLTYFQNLNSEEQTKYLSAQITELDSAINEVKDYQLFYSFSFGLSTGDEETVNWDTVNWNNLQIEETPFILPNKDIVIRSFDSIKNSFTFHQEYILPKSNFTPNPTGLGFEDDIDVKVLNYYKNGQAVDSTKVGIQPINQIQAQLKYEVVTAFDSLIILPKSTKAAYQNQEITIDTITDKGIELEMSIELYDKFIESRGKTPNHKIVKSNSYSATPIWGYRLDYLKLNNQTLKLLEETNKSSKNKSDELAKNLTEEMFASLKKINYFKNTILKDIEKFSKKTSKNDDAIFDAIKEIRSYIDNNLEYINPIKMSLSIEHPYPLQEFILYFNKTSETIQHENKFNVVNDEQSAYRVYANQENQKYGIIDSLGNIIIEAKYKSLQQSNDLYFYDAADSTEYLLNPKEKKFEPIEQGFRMHSTIKDIDIFSNKDDKLGGKKNGSEIIPFRYEKIDQINNFIVASYSLRGRPVLDFYTLDGKQLQTPVTIRKATKVFNKQHILIQKDREFLGVMDQNGKIVIPIEYRNLTSTFSDNDYFINDMENARVVSVDNKTLQIPNGIKLYSGDLIGNSAIGYYDQSKDAFGYLDKKGNVIIPGQYETITAFINGKAMVKTKNNDILMIDERNNVIKNIPHLDDDPLYLDYESLDQLRFYVGLAIYDLNGNLIKNAN